MKPRSIWDTYDRDSFTRSSKKHRLVKEGLDEIVKNYGLSDKSRVDIMCGPMSYFHADLGIDGSEALLRKNREVDEKLVHDVQSFDPFPIDRQFGYATIISGVAYLHNPEDVFRKVGGILEGNGTVIVGFDEVFLRDPITIRSWASLTSEEARTEYVQHHVRQAGFSEVNVHHVRQPYVDQLGPIERRLKVAGSFVGLNENPKSNPTQVSYSFVVGRR